MAIVVSALHVYPIKGCRGTELREALVERRGIRHDRSWLIVSKSDAVALTQRECPRLALLYPEIVEQNSILLKAPGMPDFPLNRCTNTPEMQVSVWDDKCRAIDQGDEVAAWLAEFSGFDCRLVTMPDDFARPVDSRYATGAQELGFADGYPFLLISEGSLEDLNSKLEVPVPMNRFRPNIVVSGCQPFAEDDWKRIRLGSIEFDLVKPCARCVVTTIDQDCAVAGKEPLRTLSGYRKIDKKIMFGQNLVHHSNGIIRVGDAVEIIDS